MPRLAIDASRAFIKEKTGVSWYVWQILQHLKKIIPLNWEVVLLVPKFLVNDADKNNLPQNWSFKEISIPGNKLWSQFRLAVEIFRTKPDVFFVPGHVMSYLIRNSVPTVAVVHDIVAHNFPESYSFFERFYSLSSAAHALKFAKNIIVPSSGVKEDIAKYFYQKDWLKKINEKVKIVYHGYDKNIFNAIIKEGDEVVLKKWGVTPKNYLYYIGRIENKKNTAFLVKVFDALKNKLKESGSEQKELALVISGIKGHGYEHTLMAINESPYKEYIKLTEWVSQEDSAAFYRNASAFLFPTLAEGFGMPLLEAMACGAPMVLSDILVLKEIVQDAALFSTPTDLQNWVEKTYSILKDVQLRGDLINKGFKRSELFSWEKSAMETWKIIESSTLL